MLYGPNTNGVNSIIFMHEAQAHYIVQRAPVDDRGTATARSRSARG